LPLVAEMEIPAPPNCWITRPRTVLPLLLAPKLSAARVNPLAPPESAARK
jgi:hypothetical protein